MVNLHLFNFNNQIETPRAKICVSETLKHQTDYKLFIWTENSPEIKDIISNSRYCQTALNSNPIYWPALYDYTKLHIMSRYGGWFFELDQIVIDDLSKIELEPGHSYFTQCMAMPNLLATTWMPVYTEKGIDLSCLIDKADTECVSPFSISEADYCSIPLDKEPLGAEGYKDVRYYHFETGAFKFLPHFPSGKQKVLYEKDGEVFMYCNDFYKLNLKLYTFDIFNTIGKTFNFFDIQVPLLLDNGATIFFSESLYKKISTEFTIDDRVQIIDDNKVNSDLSILFS